MDRASNLIARLSGTEKVDKECLHCLVSKPGLTKCSRCQDAYYCSMFCQKKHWKIHKQVCQPVDNIIGSMSQVNID